MEATENELRNGGFRLTIRNVNEGITVHNTANDACFRLTIRNVNIEPSCI